MARHLIGHVRRHQTVVVAAIGHDQLGLRLGPDPDMGPGTKDYAPPMTGFQNRKHPHSLALLLRRQAGTAAGQSNPTSFSVRSPSEAGIGRWPRTSLGHFTSGLDSETTAVSRLRALSPDLRSLCSVGGSAEM
jgi:hypothetical protein